jgi:hypothetical protein
MDTAPSARTSTSSNDDRDSDRHAEAKGSTEEAAEGKRTDAEERKAGERKAAVMTISGQRQATPVPETAYGRKMILCQRADVRLASR